MHAFQNQISYRRVKHKIKKPETTNVTGFLKNETVILHHVIFLYNWLFRMLLGLIYVAGSYCL